MRESSRDFTPANSDLESELPLQLEELLLLYPDCHREIEETLFEVKAIFRWLKNLKDVEDEGVYPIAGKMAMSQLAEIEEKIRGYFERTKDGAELDEEILDLLCVNPRSNKKKVIVKTARATLRLL